MPTEATKSEPMGSALRGALRGVWYKVFRHHPFHYLGAVFWAVMPGDEPTRMQRIFRQAMQTPMRFRTRCLLCYLDSVYYARYADSPALPEPNRLRWGCPLGVQAHLEALQNYSRQPGGFERDYASVLAQVRELLREKSYECVVEIGCGNGLLIEWVAKEAADSGTVFVGLDLNAEIIELNRQHYAGSRVQYHQGDSLQELLGRLRPNSLMIVAVGTFQLFTEKELLNCLRWPTANIPRGTLVVRDLTYAEADRQQHSRPGGSFAFFHNYEFLLAQAGLTGIRSQVEIDREPAWKTVLVTGSWGGS